MKREELRNIIREEIKNILEGTYPELKQGWPDDINRIIKKVSLTVVSDRFGRKNTFEIFDRRKKQVVGRTAYVGRTLAERAIEWAKKHPQNFYKVFDYERLRMDYL